MQVNHFHPFTFGPHSKKNFIGTNEVLSTMIRLLIIYILLKTKSWKIIPNVARSIV